MDNHQDLELTFSINGNPDPLIEFFKDDLKIKSTDKRVIFSKKESGIFFIQIKDLKSSDAGIYKIFCKNICGESKISIDLKVKSAPTFVKNFKNTIDCIEGTKLELNAVIGSSVYPNAQFQWSINDEIFNEADSKEIVVVKDQFSSTLIIENVSLLFDSFRIKLKSFNEIGSCESVTKIEVSSLPKFIKQLDDNQPLLNHPFEWEFVIDSFPEAKLKLLKNDKEWNLLKENRIKITQEIKTINERKIYFYKLQFSNMLADDIALYQVIAFNKSGEARSSAKLDVVGSPCFVRKPNDTSVTLSKPIKIDCEIAGIPIPNITWFKDGQPLIENERVKIENKLKTTFILCFKNCIKEDAGLYTIKLENQSGTAEENFNLSVQSNVLEIYQNIKYIKFILSLLILRCT